MQNQNKDQSQDKQKQYNSSTEPRNPMAGRQAPAAGFIEEAVDGIRDLSIMVASDQWKEFQMAADSLRRLNITMTDETYRAYALGLQVARVLLAQNREAVAANVNI